MPSTFFRSRWVTEVSITIRMCLSEDFNCSFNSYQLYFCLSNCSLSKENKTFRNVIVIFVGQHNPSDNRTGWRWFRSVSTKKCSEKWLTTANRRLKKLWNFFFLGSRICCCVHGIFFNLGLTNIWSYWRRLMERFLTWKLVRKIGKDFVASWTSLS